jgi:DNA-binding response OmpR family regulator
VIRPILVIEDDTSSARWIEVYLERAGYTVVLAHDGKTGLEMARKLDPALIVLDLMLPGLDGRELCSIVRKESEVPIIMLTALGAKEDRIDGLDGGADDYIVKPFDPDELVVRIKSVLRRYKGNFRKTLNCGFLNLNIETHEISIRGELIGLSTAQYSIMSTFMNHPNIILTRNQLIEQSFDSNFEAYERAIDSHIRRLRKLIHFENYKPLKTIYGSGYKLECTEK